MKMNSRSLFAALALLALSTLDSQFSSAQAQGTAFTYQGQLTSNAVPLNGHYDFEFSLYTNAAGTGSQVGGTLNNTDVGVTNGLFITILNFGDVFTGNDTWLAISVRSNGVGSYTPLTPLQELNPMPYAMFANTASNVLGTIPLAQLPATVVVNNESGVTLSNAVVSGAFTGNGGGLTNLNPTNLSGTVADARLSTNVALLNANQTFTGLNSFITGTNAGRLVAQGTTGIDTNLFTGLGLQYNSGNGEGAIMSSFNDGYGNLTFYTKPGSGVPILAQAKIDRYGNVSIDQQDANSGVINNGTTNGASLTFGSGSGEGIASQRTAGVNLDGLDFYTGHNRQMSILHNGNVGMGVTNPATALQVAGTVNATAFSGDGSALTNLSGNGSGLTNLNASQLTSGTVPNSVLSGFQGSANALGGGVNNASSGSTSTVGGGLLNTANGNSATVGGGQNNQATGNGATVPGGVNNLASGKWSFAAGQAAQATNQGAFVWADSQSGPFASTVNDSFNVRSQGGVNLVTSGAGLTVDGIIDNGKLNLQSSTPTIYAANNTLLYGDTKGNSFVGINAGNLTLSGQYNTGIGSAALASDTKGTDNTALGGVALYNNNIGSFNTAIGAVSLYSNTNGSNNTAVGYVALYDNTAGSDNTAIGFEALYQATGANNIALGWLAGGSLTSGGNNIYIGNQGASSDNNVMRLGSGQTETYIAGVINGNGAGLTNLPSLSLLSDPGTLNFFAGQNAGNPSITGQDNTGVGASALDIITSGNYNTAVGVAALGNNTGGSENSAFGDDALVVNSSGSDNVAVGGSALAFNSTGNDNTAVGILALADSTTGGTNAAVGSSALEDNMGGINNSAFGPYALQLCEDGIGNTAIGNSALQALTSGFGNIALGNEAGSSLQTGFGDIYIGNDGLSSENSTIRIGEFQTTAYIAGNVGLGGATPQNTLSLNGGLNIDQSSLNTGTVSANALTFGNGSGEGIGSIRTSGYTDSFGLNFYTSFNNRMTILQHGNVGIGTANPTTALEINGEFMQVDGLGGVRCYMGDDGIGNDVQVGSQTSGVTQVTFWNTADSADMRIVCCSIQINGGCDLAEPFPVSPGGQQVSEGAVVVIDKQHPGKLKMSDRAYDRRVAGVVSGANGINPGIQMQQQGLLEGGKNVALTGRVYVQADTSNGAIESGDLLTTSDTPGHAMKVSDYGRAQGAILGKAMTELSEGKGMVLVLVTLQ